MRPAAAVPRDPSSTRPLTLNALFERSARRDRHALAVKDRERSWSYGELDGRVAVLAALLRDRGVDRGRPVVIHADRSADTIAGVLAVLRAGGAFVPVSLGTPWARLESIVDDAKPALTLVDAAARARLAGRLTRLETVSLEAPAPPADPRGGEAPVTAAPVDVTPDDLAYIIYTSGTTGQPKGVMIEHGSIARRFYDWDLALRLSERPLRYLQVAPLGFDVFVADLVKAFGSGGALILCPGDLLLDPGHLHRWVTGERIDFVDMVPSLLRSLLEYLEASQQALNSLRLVICGADTWTRAEYRRAAKVLTAGRLFNGYGVTECSSESTLFEDDGRVLDAKDTLPIGRALASDRILVVDEHLAPVPPGVAGEICIGGPCVARGYLNRPELNARAFFTRVDPDGAPVRFYRTGDLGRVDEAGIFELLGRIDAQVKIHGHRVELEEIERVLERVPGVQQAIVCFDPARQVLAGYVRRQDGTPFHAPRATAYLKHHLPAYMVPAVLVPVDEIPLTPNGKVDRARLAGRHGAAGPPHAAVRSVAELNAYLSSHGVDLISIVNEFVRPSASIGLVVDTDPSAELLVFVDAVGALKRRKEAVGSHAVAYVPAPAGVAARVCVTVDALALRIDFMACETPMAAGLPATLGRIARGSVVCGPEVVDRWSQRQVRLAGALDGGHR